MNKQIIQRVNWVYGLLMLYIWNPDLMDFIEDPKRRRSKKLYYRTKGIVLHDQCLNDTSLELDHADCVGLNES